MEHASNTLASIIVRFRYALLMVALILVAIILLFGKPLKFDRSIESMFREDDPMLVDFQQLKRVFGGNEILMVAFKDRQLLDEDRSGIERLEEIGIALEDVNGVDGVMSLAVLDQVLSGRIGERNRPARKRKRLVKTTPSLESRTKKTSLHNDF